MSVNKVILVGRTTAIPEVRHTPNGNPVANFAVACNERWRDKSGENKEKVEFVNIVAWGKLADICGAYLTKGAQVYIEGKLQTRKWQDKTGADRWTTEVLASEVQFLDKKKADGGGSFDMPYDDSDFEPGQTG